MESMTKAQGATRVLRFFAADAAARQKALAPFVEGGKITVEEMHRHGETLILLTALQDSPAAANQMLDNCQENLTLACGGALYAAGDVTLFGACVEAMRQTNSLFAAADTDACHVLNVRLDKTEAARSVYDFGAQSCDHSRRSRRIRAAAQGAETAMQAAALRIRMTCRLTEADWAVACFVADKQRALAVGCEKGCWVYRLAADEVPSLWLADMLRRAALGLPQAEGVCWIDAEPQNGEQPAPEQTHPLRTVLAALAGAALVSVVTLYAAWKLTGGQPGLVWEYLRLPLGEGGAALL